MKKIKRPVGSGAWRAFAVAEDLHGRWLYTPPGSTYLGSDGDRITEWQVGRGSRDNSPPVIQLIPHTGWWTACWYGRDGYEPGQRGAPLPLISVDVCTPPSLVNGEWTYDDLELDPIMHENGTVWIDDEHEFAAACRTSVISAVEQREARRTADQITRLLQARAEPFGRSGWNHLESALHHGLPPLTVAP